MSKGRKRMFRATHLPRGGSANEFGRFVETHDLSDLLASAPLLRDSLGTGPLRPKLVRLPADVIQAVKKVAPRLGHDPTSLIRSYVVQGLRKDLKKSA